MSESSTSNKAGELFVQSLGLKGSYGLGGGLHDYVQQTRLLFMEEWLAQDPSVVATQDDHSVLVKAFTAWAPLGLEWAARRGPQSWSPTPKTPFPLVDLVRSFSPKAPVRRGTDTPVRWPPELQTWPKDKVRDFLLQGFSQAMPVKEPRDDRPVSLQALSAQEDLTRFCASDCSFFTASEKMGWLVAHQGAVVVSAFRLSDLFKSNLVFPDQIVWRPVSMRSSGNEAYFARKTALEILLSNSFELSDEQHVLEWLARHDVPEKKLEEVHEKLLDRSVKDGPSWLSIEEATARMRDGWGHESGSIGVLSWQSVLKTKPDFLADMLKSLDAKTLSRKSSTGLGVWDQLSRSFEKFPSSKERAPTWPALDDVCELDRRVPLALASQSEPLLWRVAPFPPWWESWFQRTVESSPSAWLGPKQDQSQAAARLWQTLLVGEGVSNAAQREIAATQLLLWHQAWQRCPQHVDDGVVSVLRCVQQYLTLAKIPLKTDMTALMWDTLPDPVPETLGWVKEVEDRLGQLPARPKPTASKEAFESTLGWSKLLCLPAPTIQKRSGPRF